MRIDPDGCKYIVKPDKILISLKKKKKDSHFFTLHKTKKIGLAAGGDDSDWIIKSLIKFINYICIFIYYIIDIMSA